MTTLFIILIVLASVVLGLIVLVQNPKGGGLAGNIAGFSNQFMGVKQTTDILEKGTWLFGAIIGILCMLSVVFISKSTSAGGVDRTSETTGAPVPANNNTQQVPAGAVPLTPTPTTTQPANAPK